MCNMLVYDIILINYDCLTKYTATSSFMAISITFVGTNDVLVLIPGLQRFKWLVANGHNLPKVQCKDIKDSSLVCVLDNYDRPSVLFVPYNI